MRADRRRIILPILLGALYLAPAAAQEADEEARPPERSPAYRVFTSAKGTFACDVPAAGWQAFEEDTPLGTAAHFLGPAEENGSWRAALHVHFVDKAAPGFVPIDDAVKRERRSDPAAGRGATSVRRVRVSRVSARRFEVTETRLLPGDRLPAAPAVLHHFFAFVPAGDGYMIIKLSTSRESYQGYRELFERILRTFRVLGY